MSNLFKEKKTFYTLLLITFFAYTPTSFAACGNDSGGPDDSGSEFIPAGPAAEPFTVSCEVRLSASSVSVAEISDDGSGGTKGLTASIVTDGRVGSFKLDGRAISVSRIPFTLINKVGEHVFAAEVTKSLIADSGDESVQFFAAGSCSRTLTVYDEVDFEVTDLNLRTGTLEVGKTVDFRASYRNNGPGAIKAPYLGRFYYKFSDECSACWKVMSEKRRFSALNAGAETFMDSVPPLSLNRSGTLRVVYKIDAANEIRETNESNNQLVKSFKVVDSRVIPPDDLPVDTPLDPPDPDSDPGGPPVVIVPNPDPVLPTDPNPVIPADPIPVGPTISATPPILRFDNNSLPDDVRIRWNTNGHSGCTLSGPEGISSIAINDRPADSELINLDSTAVFSIDCGTNGSQSVQVRVLRSEFET